MRTLSLAFVLIMSLLSCQGADYRPPGLPPNPGAQDFDARFLEDYIGPGDDVGLEDDAAGFD